MKHPAIIIFSILYILNLFIKIPGISELLLLPATIIFVFGYTLLLLVIYFIVFIFSLLISIFTADGERFLLSFAIFFGNLMKTANLEKTSKIFDNLFFHGTAIGVISYIILGLIYVFIIYAFVSDNNTSPKDLTKENNDTKDKP